VGTPARFFFGCPLGAVHLGRQSAYFTIQFIDLLFVLLALLVCLPGATQQFRQTRQGDLFPFFQLRRVDTQFRSQLIHGLFFFHQLFDRFCLECRTVVFAHRFFETLFSPFSVSKFLGPL